ncbi:protein CC2D2B [Dama dama]
MAGTLSALQKTESELKVFCSKNILSILGFSCIIAVIALLALGLTQNKALPENVKFGIVLDAGSSHTSLYIYRWPAEKENDTGVVTQIEECKLKGPGISGFAKKLHEINVYLTACMERARKVIPSAQHPETPVYLGATAGMRLLRMENQQMADKILDAVANSISKYPFDFQGARIISGQEEGAYGWITVNYLLGKFTQKLSWFNLKPSKDDTQETYGALDLGGASTQITFVPQNEMTESPNNNLYFRLYGKNYSVYTHSFLCYGKDQALLQKLALELQGASGIVYEPCFHSGYLRKMKMSVFNEGFCARRHVSNPSYYPLFDIEVRGTGNFQQCQQGIIQLFNSSYCPYSSCSFNGVFLPPLQGQFGAFSAFYYVMEFLNLTSQEQIPTKKLTEKLEEFCAQSWKEVHMNFGDVKEAYLSEYCFSGTYILALLLNGYHFTDESWKNIHFMNKMSEDTDNTAGEENVEKHLQKDLNVEENRSIIKTLRGKVREKLKNAKINQGEKSSTQLLIDNKIYQWSKAEVPLDEGLSFFVLSGEEDSAIGQSAEQNFSEGQDEDFVEEVIFPDLLEVKAADYEDDQEQIKKQQANIFIPSSSPVINQLKLPEDMMPRILEEEGFYIQKKPEIYKKTCNKMENRLLKLEEGKCWFEESGEIMSLPSPIRRSWNFRLNISKEPLNPALKTMYRKYIKHKGQDIPKYFRLEQLQDEFNFVSEEEMKKSKRFQLLQLRNAGQLDVFLLQQMPLYDREIPDLVFQEYESQIGKDVSISDVNSITAQRINSANFLQKMRRLVMRRIVKVSKFNLSDIVADYEEIVSARSLGMPTYLISSMSHLRHKETIKSLASDEILNKDHCFRSCSGHSYVRKNWLGSIVFPFSALLQQSEISGTFQVNIPPVLLGYTWSKTYVSPKEDYNGQNLKECTFLNIFATIEPQISYAICSPELDKFSDQIDVLERAWIFTKNCKALFPKRRIITTVFNDEGIQILVIRYIKALNPPQQLLDMFLHYSNATLDLVAHFVSLIPVMPDALDENDGFNIWMTSERCISLAIGNKEEHAILLCNFFLYFGKKALVLLGTSVLEGHVAYVLTQETDEYLLWNPLTGQCHKQFDPFCPLQGVDCLFDGENVWFNLQQNNSPMAVYFDYSKESFWKQLLPKNYQGTNTQSVQPEEIIYSDTNKSMVEDLKNRIERTLKCKIMEWRPKQPTRWNRQCTLILRQILPKLELGTASFVLSEEESEFERLLQFYWVTGFPIQMPYTDVQSVIDAVYQTGIHCSEFPQTEFALAVYIHPYPNNILSVWVYLASLARHQ